MRNFQALFAGIDPTPLLLAIKRQPELWHADTYLRDYPQGPFGTTDTIMLRFPKKTVKETEKELLDYGTSDAQHECVDYIAMERLEEARSIIFGIMTKVQGERLGRVMINRVKPGGSIFRHADTPVHCAYYSRFHYVLQTNPQAVLCCGDESLNLEAGTVWWFNNALEHEVLNAGSNDRIHMIVDVHLRRPAHTPKVSGIPQTLDESDAV